MNARDELAGIISDHHVWNGDEGCSGKEAAADAILAAGYRKPRTITTAEELDALSIGAVVLADGYRHHANNMPIAFQRWSDGEWHRGARAGSTHPDNIVPATVIHEGAAS